MKKIIILSVVVTFILAGVLYATYEQPDEVETVTAARVHMGHVSYEMPEIIPDPMLGFPLY
jgi:flagellar basal body-associated protein FliL